MPFRGLECIFSALLIATAACPAETGKQQAVDQDKFGTIHFPISCPASVQKEFERGVALLHSFAFETAEATFRQVVQDDSQCAMGHWGMARSLWRWSEPDSKIRAEGWREAVLASSLKPPTQREKEYVAAVSALYENPDANLKNRWNKYLEQMRTLHRDYLNDDEATAFYAYALIEADNDDDPTHKDRRLAAALLEPLFARDPDHPGIAHYLIHAYDKPDLAELGLPAARRYALIAPAAPHALHMPSHIFAQLGMWQEDISSNLASLAASRNASTTHMEDMGHEYHAMEFLVYAYLQSGREAEAQKLIDEVRSLPKVKSMYGDDYDPQVYASLAYQASYLLELHQWAEAAVLPLTPQTAFGDDTITYLVRAVGSARIGNVEQARKNVEQIESIHAQVVARKLPFADWVEQEKHEAEAWADHAAGNDDEALALLAAIAEKQQTGIFGANGDLPAREMRADILLEMKRPQQALREYQAELKISPNRFDSLYGAGRAAETANQKETAANYYRQLLNVCAWGTSSRPELAQAKEFVSQFQ